MSEAEIKIVTRTCITCQHEPQWRLCSPSRADCLGECESPKFLRPNPKIFLQGQVATVKMRGENTDETFYEPIVDCPAWKPKTVAVS